MDGDAMVSLAEQWMTVPPQHIFKTLQLLEERSLVNTHSVMIYCICCY